MPEEITRQIVTWENGAPVVSNVPILAPKQISDIGAAVVAMPYITADDELAIEMGLPPSEYYGKTLMEVMLIKQAREAARTGDREDVEAILDRRLGKPKTTAENHNITETYEGALNRIAAAANAKPAPMDAEIVEPWDNL